MEPKTLEESIEYFADAIDELIERFSEANMYDKRQIKIAIIECLKLSDIELKKNQSLH